MIKIFIFFLLTSFSENSYSRVYLPDERFFSESECVPRVFCSIMKNYVLTEPLLIRPVLQEYQRLVKQKEILSEYNDVDAFLLLNTVYAESKSNTYWTFYDGVGVESQIASNNFRNNWAFNLRWAPFNLTGLPDQEKYIDVQLQNYFYLARLRVYTLLDPFLIFRSNTNIFSLIQDIENLSLVNFALPLVKDFFKKEMFLYKQKLTPMDDVLEIYNTYNNLLDMKISRYNGIHDYAPVHVRLKNFVQNSIDALILEFQDMVEDRLDLTKLNICSRKTYLEESARRQIYDLKVGFGSATQRYRNNLSGFNLNLGGPINEPMNLTSSIAFNFSYQLFETPEQSIMRWDYIIERKNISDDLTKAVEMEEVDLNEKFLRTRAEKENYLQRKENREQVYLLLKGKIINRLGDKNFKFGFNTITEKVQNLRTVLQAETSYVNSMLGFTNALFISLSQCPLSEEIVESLENM